MKEIKIPQGYQQLMPYLIIKGAAGFISFMQHVFGAEEIMKHMRSEGVIMHAEVKIGECVIMFADSTSEYPPRTGGFFVYVADADETYNKAIAAGAVSLMPVSDQPYGRSCGITDPFGNTWWPTAAA